MVKVCSQIQILNLAQILLNSSRTMNAGELFFCIKGENTDGHHYIPQALEKGACAVVADPASIPEAIRQSSFPRILVPDPNLALREWAADIRKRFTGKVLAVTGSNGKTTTKELINTVLSEYSGEWMGRKF